MNSNKLVKDGMVQGVRQEEARDKVFNGIVDTMIKTAGDGKEQKKEQKEKDKAEKKEQKFKDKMTKKEAEESGFFKSAKNCGWGIYTVSDLDGGLGSIWYLEKDSSGTEYLVKQIDNAGEVVRRIKASSQTVSA